MWVLILTLISTQSLRDPVIKNSEQTSPAVSIESISGFTSLATCNAAAEAWMYQMRTPNRHEYAMIMPNQVKALCAKQ